MNRPDDGSLPVETVRISTVCAISAELNIRRVDLLKSDTEGLELEVLSGAMSMLKSRAIDAILIEAGLTPTNPWHTPLPALIEKLDACDFRLLGLFNQTPGLQHYGVDFCDALFLRSELLPGR